MPGALPFGLHSSSIHTIQAQLLGQAFSHDVADEAGLAFVMMPWHIHRRTCSRISLLNIYDNCSCLGIISTTQQHPQTQRCRCALSQVDEPAHEQCMQIACWKQCMTGKGQSLHHMYCNFASIVRAACVTYYTPVLHTCLQLHGGTPTKCTLSERYQLTIQAQAVLPTEELTCCIVDLILLLHCMPDVGALPPGQVPSGPCFAGLSCR